MRIPVDGHRLEDPHRGKAARRAEFTTLFEPPQDLDDFHVEQMRRVQRHGPLEETRFDAHAKGRAKE